MNRPANQPANLTGNRPGNQTGIRAGSRTGTGPLTEPPHVRAIASRPVPARPDRALPDPGAIPPNKEKLKNGNPSLSAVNAEVAREPEITRMQAIRIAREMYANEWRLFQIREYLASRGQKAHRMTIKRWVDPEYAEKSRETNTRQRRVSERDRKGTRAFTVLDADARARLAVELDRPLTDELMLALRVQDGLSYPAIAKVANRLYGQNLTADGVRYRLNKLGAAKNPRKVRSAGNGNLHRGKATA